MGSNGNKNNLSETKFVTIHLQMCYCFLFTFFRRTIHTNITKQEVMVICASAPLRN